MKKPHRTTPDSMEEEKQELTDTDPTIFTATSDLCQQLLDRYGKSAAPQHRHLCATAAATRSILQSESLPLTPLSYFAAAIDAVSVKALDSDAVSALSAFLGIVLPLVPGDSIAPEKAADAVAVLVEMVERRPSEAAVSAPGVRALVKCLGVLVGFCDLEDWESVKLGFETLLKFSIDKRPKVRRCAQDCVLKAFKSFKSSAVIKDASKYVLFMLKGYMPLAATISAMGAKDGYKDETLLKPEDLAVLHFLNVLKLVVPCLSVKVNLRVLAQLHKLMSSQFSALTRHIFGIIETMFETPEGEVAAKEVENIIESLASYIFLGEKNPSDTILSAATLSKSALDKLYTDEPTKWISNLPLVVGSVVGLLTSETSASQASVVIKELINQLTDTSDFSSIVGQPVDDEVKLSKESKAIESMCSIFHNVLSACGGIPNEHILAVISVLFIKLGKRSYFYMKSILLELAEVMTIACRKFDRKHLEECIGSAVSAIGPEKILALIPISFNAEDRTCSNIWLIPILKNYVVGSSLGFFMQHVVPLAESLQRACQKVKKSEIGEDLQAHARGCWGLLSAFCRGPTDTYENFGPLVKLLIPFLTKDSWMLENVAIALQELVNENRSAPGSNQRAGEFEKVTNTSGVNNSLIELKCRSSYSKKIARRNIKALASCSEELLQAIVDVLFDSPPEKHAYLKDAIGCFASITDSAVIKKIFITSLERFQLMDSSGEYGKIGGHSNVSIDKVRDISTSAANRCLILELASSLVGGASEDLIGIIYSFVKHTLQGTDENAEPEAYYTLSRILEEHSWFCTSQFIELMDFLLGLKAPVDVASLRSRFACFQILLIHAIKRSSDEENAKAFLILNEIIVTIKDSKEEVRKAAYDILLGINSSLRDSSSAISDGPYHKLISMIMGYLSSSSPQIKSGAVSALSVLVHSNADICLVIPDLVPSVLALLQTKAVEVIKAALGFVKVLVSCLEARDLHKILPDAISGVLSWSSISRHHFRAKVTVILEIMMRKCGAVAVESLAPQKYSSFVKSVSEGRHGKTNSKETGSNDAQNKLSDSSARGSFRQQNRKRKESNISPEEDGLREPRKRKWENPQKGNAYRTREPHIDSGSGNGAKGAKRPRYSNHDKSNECLSRGGSRNSRGGSRNGRNFNKESSSSGKRTEQSKGNKKSEAADHRNFNPSKFTKHKRVARKGQNFSK